MATPLQKTLFLYTRQQKEKSYDFIPYRFGCFSLLANQDLLTLEKLGYVTKEQTNHSTIWKLKSEDNFIAQLKKEDVATLNHIYHTYHSFNTNALIKHTYVNYPFWAINSTILDDVLTNEEKTVVLQQKKQYKDDYLFTIGYEGISLETYINKLIINDVKVLCDVRKNSYSQKWGFSKSTLQDACEKVGIKFIHIPQLGIESEERQELNTIADYKTLFKHYESKTLKENWNYLLNLSEILKNNKRVALTCFEKNIQMCHRSVVANNLMNLPALEKFQRKDL